MSTLSSTYNINSQEDFEDFLKIKHGIIEKVFITTRFKDFCLNSINSIIKLLETDIKDNKTNYDFSYIIMLQKIFYEKFLKMYESYNKVLENFKDGLKVIEINNNENFYKKGIFTDKYTLTYNVILIEKNDIVQFFEKQINKVNSLVYTLKTNK